MTDLQLYIAIGLPTLAVLASLTVSIIQISAIREDVREVRREMADLRKEMNEVRKEVNEVRKEMNELRREVNTKIDLLMGKIYELMTERK